MYLNIYNILFQDYIMEYIYFQENEAYIGEPRKYDSEITKNDAFSKTCEQFHRDLSFVLDVQTDWDITGEYKATFIDQRKEILDKVKFRGETPNIELFEVRMSENKKGENVAVIKALNDEAKGLLAKLSGP